MKPAKIDTQHRQNQHFYADKMNKKIIFVDWIRIVACFLVMLVHASESFYAADNSGLAGNVSMLANETNRFWVAFYDGGIARTCVPLFMMVSSFLLVPIGKDVSMSAFYRKRFKRILPPFFFFLLLYIFLPLAWGGMEIGQSITDLKMFLLNFPSMGGHLWFMYPLIGLYLIMPVISPWLERASAKDLRLFIAIFSISSFIPWLHTFVSADVWGECFWNRFHMLWYFSGYIGYLVMAYYIRVHLNWDLRNRLAMGTICFLAGSVFTAWSFWWKGVPGKIIETPLLEWSWEFCTPNQLLATFGAFVLFSCISDNSREPKLVSEIARLSFPMYLMHMFFLALIAKAMVAGDVVSPLIPVWLAIPCIAILTYICCIATAKLLSLLPGSKWFLGA